MTLGIATLSDAKSINCRVVTGSTKACNPYATRFLKVKDTRYYKNRETFLETLSSRKKVKVISVNEMLQQQQNRKIDSSLRFSTTHTGTRHLRDKVKVKIYHGYYIVKQGDILGSIGEKFDFKIKDILEHNAKLDASKLRIGQKISLPFSQSYIDAVSSGKYTIKSGDNLSSIAYEFQLSTDELVKFNGITKDAILRIGQTLKLPLSYIMVKHEIALNEAMAKIKEQKLAKVLELKVKKTVYTIIEKKVKIKKVKKKIKVVKKKKAHIKKKKLVKKKKHLHFKHSRKSAKHSLRVTATAYSSHAGQTDSTPFLAAWNNHIRPGMKIIAVSRDLLTRYGLHNGSKIKIGGLHGHYTVRDKMNKRYKKRIDIYMGINRRKALRWGRKNVVISW